MYHAAVAAQVGVLVGGRERVVERVEVARAGVSSASCAHQRPPRPADTRTTHEPCITTCTLCVGGHMTRYVLLMIIVTAVGPMSASCKDPDLGVGEVPVVRPFAVLGVGVPGRHLFVDDFFLDRLSPRTNFLEAHHRKRSDFSRAMTFGAAFEKDRRDVFVEGDVLGG